jgi:hypothetical protein
MSESKPLPKLVIGLAIALAVAIAVIAFLLGRESTRAVVVRERVRVVEPGELPVEQAPASSPSVDTARSERSPEPEVDRDAAVIEAYFQEMDSIQSGASAPNPREFANQILGAGVGGDLTGFDKLLADMKKMEAGVARVRPPQAAAQHHTRTRELLTESRRLLEEMRRAMAGQDLGNLAGLADRAREMQTQTEDLQQMEKELRARASRR